MKAVDWLVPWRATGFVRRLCVLLFLGVVSIGGIWLWMINSDPYKVAVLYLRQSQEIEMRFGTPVDISVRSFRMDADAASFVFFVKGKVSSGSLSVSLRSKGNWHVEKVSQENRQD
jgi:hypothetical protein